MSVSVQRAPDLTKDWSSQLLLGQTVLAVEDDILISFDLESMLRDAGADVVCARTTDDAIREAQRIDLTAAVLDIELEDGSAEPVCECLYERRIPFIFATGYSEPSSFRWKGIPLISKPYSSKDIVKEVRRALVGEVPTATNVARLRQLIAEAEIRLWRHQELIERLEAKGFDTTQADKLLWLMEKSLSLLRNNLELFDE